MRTSNIDADEWSNLALVAQDPASPKARWIYRRLKSPLARQVAWSLIAHGGSVPLSDQDTTPELTNQPEVEEIVNSLRAWARGNRRSVAVLGPSRQLVGKMAVNPRFKTRLNKIAEVARNDLSARA